MDRAALRRFLASHRYGVVSSTAETGAPQSALVGIAVTEELEIVFDTLKSSRKYANLVARPACSLVIGWEGEQTLQLEGRALEPTGTELRRFQETYLAAWPDSLARQGWPGIAYLVVQPSWIRYSDYDQQPPLVQVFDDVLHPKA